MDAYDRAIKDSAALKQRVRNAEEEEATECARDGMFVALCDDGVVVHGMWFRSIDGALHRGGGRPAVQRGNGTLEWWENNQLHRANDLPAIEHADGRRDWLVRGKYRRAAAADAAVAAPPLPAVVLADGTRVWVQPATGLVHRDHGLPAIERADGTLEFFEHGLRHRADGLPAVFGPQTARYFERGREVPHPDAHGCAIPCAVNAGVVEFGDVAADHPMRKSVRTFWQL